MKRDHKGFEEWQRSWGSQEWDFYREFLKNGGRHPAMLTTLADEGQEAIRDIIVEGAKTAVGIYLYPEDEDASYRSFEIFNLLMKEAVILCGLERQCLQISIVDLYNAIAASDEDFIERVKCARHLFIEDFATYYDDDWLEQHKVAKKRMRGILASRLFSPERVTHFRGLPIPASKAKRNPIHEFWDRDLLQLISKRTVSIGVG